MTRWESLLSRTMRRLNLRSALPNKCMHQTKGAWSGRFAAGLLEAPFAGDARCCADQEVSTFLTAKTSEESLSSRWSTKKVVVGPSSPAQQLRRHHRGCPVSARERQGSAGVPIKKITRLRGVGPNQRQHNKRLERTKREGVPASRAIFFSSLRRSTWCWTDVDEVTR